MSRSSTRSLSRKARTNKTKLCFIDVFSGCGGLSLGLMGAGWIGLLAIERRREAFSTFTKNLIDGKRYSFIWPAWLPKKAHSTGGLLAKYEKHLMELRGKIDLVAGAPPCQGFSFAGRRLHSDPRNSLFRQYLKIVRLIEPRMLLVENVQGFSIPFKKSARGQRKHMAYSKVLTEMLHELGYTVFSELVNVSDFGVPQNRTRFIMIAVRNSDQALKRLRGRTPFEILRSCRPAFLKSKRLGSRHPVSSRQALADLETIGKPLIECPGQPIKGFKQINYSDQGPRSRFVRLMRRDSSGPPDSLRLPRHKPETLHQFEEMLATCRRGWSLTKQDRERLGIKKRALVLLHPNRPSSTVTTLPDDIIHYSEPRILTVRENARLQSFPDWFEFTGKYTTGNRARRRECPRYTQVGNAVPPLFAEALGVVLRDIGS